MRVLQERIMDCRVGCGACCIAPSISSPIPGMPEGKPGGVRCVQLDENNHCQLFGQSSRPGVCLNFQASEEFCGHSNETALQRITLLEQESAP
jgi:Fe-S-cluster containining protein